MDVDVLFDYEKSVCVTDDQCKVFLFSYVARLMITFIETFN